MKVKVSRNYSHGETPIQGDVVGMGDLVLELDAKLKSGVAHFAYVKKGGELRHAFGTLKPQLLPKRSQQVLAELRDKFAKKGQDVWAERMQSTIEHLDSETSASKARQDADGWVNYFDFEAGDWRKFHIDNLVAIIR